MKCKKYIYFEECIMRGVFRLKGNKNATNLILETQLRTYAGQIQFPLCSVLITKWPDPIGLCMAVDLPISCKMSSNGANVTLF